MKKEFAIAIGLVLLIASMPYASATTIVDGPYVDAVLQPPDIIPIDSSFKVNVSTDILLVEAAYVNITIPPELQVDIITVDPRSVFALSRYQSDSDGLGMIFAAAEAAQAANGPLLASIVFTATQEGTYTIDLSSVINGVADAVEPLTITVIAVPGDVTEDGIVDFRDLVAVIENWGGNDLTFDADGNGEVGYSDINYILAHWTG